MDKVKKLKKNYIGYGIFGNVAQYGLPISYIVWQYEIFKFEEATKSLTGWGFVTIAIAYFLLKDKIKNFVTQYNDNLGQVAQKGKWGIGFLTFGAFLALASLWITGAMWFLLVLGGSNLLSLPIYSLYFTKKKDYTETKTMILNKRKEEKIKGLTI